MILRDFPYTIPNTSALEFARGNPAKVMDSSGAETTLAALYDAYIGSPITNVPLTIIRNGHRIAEVGDAALLYETIWNELMNGH
jgi:hypothetical protein